MYWTTVKLHSFFCEIQVFPALRNSYVPGEILRWVVTPHERIGITGSYIPRWPKSGKEKLEVNSFIAWNVTRKQQKCLITAYAHNSSSNGSSSTKKLITEICPVNNNGETAIFPFLPSFLLALMIPGYWVRKILDEWVHVQIQVQMQCMRFIIKLSMREFCVKLGLTVL
jgi:hypothetical protein